MRINNPIGVKEPMTKVLKTVKRIVNDVKQLLPFPYKTDLPVAQKKLNNYLQSQQFLALIQSLRDEGVDVQLLNTDEDIVDDDLHNTVCVSTFRNSPELLDYFLIGYADMAKIIKLDASVAISCFFKENPDYVEFMHKKNKIGVELIAIEDFICQSIEMLFIKKLEIKQLTDLAISFNQKWGKYPPISLNLKIKQNIAQVELSCSEIEIADEYFLKIGKSRQGFSVNIDNATIPDVLSTHISPQGELTMIITTNSTTPTLLNNNESNMTLPLPTEENLELPEAIKVLPKERPSQCGFFSVSTVGAATAAVVLATVVGTLGAGMSYFRNDI